MATFTDRVLILNSDGNPTRIGASDTIALSTGNITLTNGNLTVGGNLTVSGETFSNQVEKVLISDNHLYVNANYTSVAAQSGGLVVNYLPTATSTTTIGSGVFTAGVNGVSNPTVTTAGAATFSASDIIQVSGSLNGENDGLYEVVSHAANLLTVRSTSFGTTNQVEDFTDNQFVSNAGDTGATISKLNVSILRAGTDGIWETGTGSSTGISFTDLAVGGGGTLQSVYAAGNTIVTDVSAGPLDVSGTQAISLDAGAASNFTVAGAGLTFSTTTSGAISVSSAGIVDIDSASTMSINSSGAAINVGNDAVAQAINIGTGAAARTITLGNVTGATALDFNAGTGGIDIDATGVGTIDIGANAGSGAINIGTNAVARVLTFGNVTSSTSVTLNSGTGGLSLNSTGTGDITVVSGDQFLVDSAGSIELNSSAAAISIGNDAVAQAINVGTGAAARTITLGNVTGATAVVINSGTGDISGNSTDSIFFDAQGVTGTITNTLGTNTTATSFKVRNNSNVDQFTVLGSGQADFVGNVDASSGLDIDADNQSLTIGAGADLSMVHNGTNTTITSATGDLIIDNTLATGSTINRLGTDTAATDFQVQNNSASTLFSVNGIGEIATPAGILMTERSVPSAAAANTGYIYVKEDPSVTNFTELWFFSDLNGTDTELQITKGGFLNSGAIVNTSFVAATGGITAGNALFLSSATEVGLADATTSSGADFVIGIALNTVIAAATVRMQSQPGTVVTTSTITSFSAAGDVVYLSETAGGLTTVAPTASGSTIFRVGYAITATTMLLQPQMIALNP